MKLDIYFVALLSGYTFLVTCNLTKFTAARQEGYRLIFESAFTGLILTAVSYICMMLMNTFIPNTFWRTIAPSFLQDEIAQAVTLAFPFSILLALTLNQFYDKGAGVIRAITKDQSLVETLLVKAMNRAQKKAPGCVVELVLDDNSVIAGIVESFDAVTDEDKHLELIVLAQGRVDEQGKTLGMELSSLPKFRSVLPLRVIRKMRLVDG